MSIALTQSQISSTGRKLTGSTNGEVEMVEATDKAKKELKVEVKARLRILYGLLGIATLVVIVGITLLFVT